MGKSNIGPNDAEVVEPQFGHYEYLHERPAHLGTWYGGPEGREKEEPRSTKG